MKTQTFTQRNALKTLGLFGLFMIFTIAANPIMAQTERTVKGVISDDVGPIEGATVILKGTNIYVDTDNKGTFTFPQKLKENDELVVSLLGYKKKEVTIGTNTSFLKILMNDYDIVIIGSLMMGNNETLKSPNQN